MSAQKKSILVTRFPLAKQTQNQFSSWQAKFRSAISGAPGFISIEILTPCSQSETECVLNQRFDSETNLQHWKNSSSYQTLLKDLKSSKFIDSNLQPTEQFSECTGGVTQVYVTHVDKDKITAFQNWLEKLHEYESRVPGFQKVYVQAPNNQKKEGSWITLLQFDNENNLENWMNSKERTELLKESSDFIEHQDSHRLLSSFGGWFTDTFKNTPPVWKQSMVVLLMLYPLIMLEFIFLYPYLTQLDTVFSRFLGCAITCLLLAWPLMPAAIYLLQWWLNSKSNLRLDILGVMILCGLYIIEIAAFYFS